MNAITAARNFIPALQINTPFVMASKITALSIPIFALASSSLILPVKADTYTECIDACDRNGRDAGDLAKLICYAFCWWIS